jgi:hypothetical protein
MRDDGEIVRAVVGGRPELYAEIFELYRRRGRTKEANESARRPQDFREELAELLRKGQMK